MSENNCIPHIRLPRSLLKDPLWVDLPLAYQNVFLVLVEKVCFKPQRFDDHGVLIDLKPGQICISERQLLKFCNKYVSRNDIQRSIKKFILYDFVSQEVRHKKSILTIKHKDTYELILKCNEPRSEPNLSQTRAKLEPEKKKEEKEEKEEYNNSREALDDKKIFSFDSSQENSEVANSNDTTQHNVYNQTKLNENNLKEQQTNENKNKERKTKTEQKKSKAKIQSEEYRQSLIERRPNIYISAEEHAKLIKELGNELTEKCYDELSEWKTSKSLNDLKSVVAHSDYYRMTKWVIKAVKEKDIKQPLQSNSVEENKKFAQQVANSFFHENYKIEALSSTIEFTPLRGQVLPDIIKYTDNGFREQVKNTLTKRLFKEKTTHPTKTTFEQR